MKKRLSLFFEVTTGRRTWPFLSCFGKTTSTDRRSGAGTTLFCVYAQNNSKALATATFFKNPNPAAAPLTPDTYARFRP